MPALAARDSEEATEGSYFRRAHNLMEAENQRTSNHGYLWTATHTHLTAARRANATWVPTNLFLQPKQLKYREPYWLHESSSTRGIEKTAARFHQIINLSKAFGFTIREVFPPKLEAAVRHGCTAVGAPRAGIRHRDLEGMGHSDKGFISGS